MKKRSVVLMLLVALVLVLAIAGSASAARTLYWTHSDQIRVQELSMGAGYVVLVPEPDNTNYASIKVVIYARGGLDYEYTMAKVEGIQNYPFFWGNPASGRYTILAFAVDDNGRSLATLHGSYVIEQ